MPVRAAFLGSPEFAVPSLRALAQRAEIPLVLTQPDRPSGRGLETEPTAVRQAATELGLPVRTWERGQRASIEQELAGLQLDVLVVVAFGIILKPSTLNLATRGALNVHASVLPRWRGVAPIERALQAGDATTGVTLMVIDAGVDTGPVLASERLAIAADDTRLSLATRLASAGAALLAARLPAYLAGELTPEPQPSEGVSYAPRLLKSEGRIDWSQAADVIDRQVRAFYDWPGAFTRLNGVDLKVHAVRVHATPASAPAGTLVVAHPKDGVHVACGSGRLELLQVQRPGKGRVAAADLVRGRVLQVGQRFDPVA